MASRKYKNNKIKKYGLEMDNFSLNNNWKILENVVKEFAKSVEL